MLRQTDMMGVTHDKVQQAQGGRSMRILIACEESQAVCTEMRRLGHEAYSCDIQKPSGGHPEWHILGDALEVLDGGTIVTMDSATHEVGKWDMLIAHPPCTHLAVSGARWFAEGRKPRHIQDDAAAFFMKFIFADIPKIAVENPVSVMSTRYRKPDQIINPWQFGHPEQKKTCLWLKNLPLLRETDNVYDHMMTLPQKNREKTHYQSPSPDRNKLRSKTYTGIAKAMAEQWAGKMEAGDNANPDD